VATIDEFSVAVTPLRLFFGQKLLSSGTGFFWQAENTHFLITNWHNFSGRDPNTGKHLSETGAEPDRVALFPFQKGQLNSRIIQSLPLRDHYGAPLWFVHPQHGKQIDVVALPIPASIVAMADMYAINVASSKNLKVQIGLDVFIIGYPLGPELPLTPPVSPALLLFPVWKRGSIATEPEVFVGPQQHILIDTASRPGMSGSPVILRSWGTHHLADGSVEIGGAATRLFGVYSGRVGTKDALDAQLGICWPIALVEQIVAGKKRDSA
jgi:hypothetical protein